MKVVVLVSGGLDSVTALYEAAESHEVVAGLSFRYGAKHHDSELPLAAWHCEKLGVAHRVIELPFVGELFSSALLEGGAPIPDGHYEEATMKATVVPFRNGIMLSIAAGFAESRGAEALVIAAHAGDHAIYPDCREAFMNAMGEAVRMGTYAGIELQRPFITKTKADLVRRGHELGVDFARTWSCYKGHAIHCGQCGTCTERREAFLVAGLPDPTPYETAGPLPPKPVPC